ncbi:MAG: pyridoxal-phosphate dependent enzyme [Thiomicrorhabdus sp.]|jgi:1-aminocyclopropane-1-carboxylate deaminase|nr:pyridoxal-phosphate dependent enzyme [Thiomicrorhabdus sp.]
MKATFSVKTTPMTQLSCPLFDEYQVKVWMKREELNHPTVQGNKLHKLKCNIDEAVRQQKDSLLTFGGAYSNHIAATAAAAKQVGLKSIGFIRGEELALRPDKWSPTLKLAQQNGMTLYFISRLDYREKKRPDTLQKLQSEFPQAYILPEGGSNILAVQGFESLMTDIEMQCPDWTHLYTSVGTGGTLAGLVSFAKFNSNRTLIGVGVLKNADYLTPFIEQWILQVTPHNPVNQWQLLTQYHMGGYAKKTAELLQQMSDFEMQFMIDLEPIYTAKMIMAFYDQLQNNLIKPGSKVVLLHTGGLQGNPEKL